MNHLTLHIDGMACGGCANTVRQALLGLEGVTAAEVTHAEGRARVSFDPAGITPQQIADAVSAAGYPAAVI